MAALLACAICGKGTFVVGSMGSILQDAARSLLQAAQSSTEPGVPCGIESPLGLAPELNANVYSINQMLVYI